MAHFVRINEANVVVFGAVIADKDILDENGNESEAVGIEFCKKLFGDVGTYLQTSYNTFYGVHKTGKTPFRWTYASEGFTYDKEKDMFLDPAPFPSWVNSGAPEYRWNPPVSYPLDGKLYRWDETIKNWSEVINGN